ncbi:MAG: hypothetical protein AB7S44_02795 [Spirochaetales bacterium]
MGNSTGLMKKVVIAGLGVGMALGVQAVTTSEERPVTPIVLDVEENNGLNTVARPVAYIARKDQELIDLETEPENER